MAYSEILANRVRELLVDLTNIEEQEMMGGLMFKYNGKMCVCIIKDDLMCRINPELHDMAVEKTGCRTMDFTKRPMKGFIMIDETGTDNINDLKYWVQLALDFNKFAKAKKKKPNKKQP